MPEAGDGIAFVQPLGELTVRGHDGDTVHLFTLRLMDDTLRLVPRAETGEDLAAGPATPPAPPGLVRWIGARLLGSDLARAHLTFRPHPLRDTDVTLGGPYLHVRLGRFDAEYGPGDFDPDAAATFVARYQEARRQASR